MQAAHLKGGSASNRYSRSRRPIGARKHRECMESIPDQSVPAAPERSAISASPLDYIRLARPMQWAKGVFVLIGPIYGIPDHGMPHWPSVIAAFFAFAFASSACYVHNDIRDREADRAHPRKKNRPIAAGRIGVGAAYGFFALLVVLALACVALVPGGAANHWQRELLCGCVALYVVNVLAYSIWLKHKIVADVISLSLGFVLRVLGGCAAVAVEPSSLLLNVTFFLSMFLAFGKRLGERRTMGASAAAARGVQSKYTDDLLRMAMVVTGVATLLTYATYVQDQYQHYTLGFNLLWVTMLPAFYGLFRAIVKVETGQYDDPTEMAIRDRPFQASAVVFGLITVVLIALFRMGYKDKLGW